VEKIIKTRSFQDQDREYRIQAEVLVCGRDICILISGGDQPHIGAVALAFVTESPSRPRKWSATPSVIAVPGHKEYHLALAAAEQLSKTLEKTVVVSVGIHIDGITPELVNKVKLEVQLLVADLAESILKLE
jgi:hypothetical protein